MEVLSLVLRKGLRGINTCLDRIAAYESMELQDTIMP